MPRVNEDPSNSPSLSLAIGDQPLLLQRDRIALLLLARRRNPYIDNYTFHFFASKTDFYMIIPQSTGTAKQKVFDLCKK